MGRWTYLNSKAAMYAAISAAWSAEVELILTAFTRGICVAERAQNQRQRGEWGYIGAVIVVRM